MDLQEVACESKREGVYVKIDAKLWFIEKVVCRIVGIHPDDLKRKSRKGEYVKSRQIIYYMAYKYLMPSPGLTVGSLAGRYGQSHSTAVHGRKAIRNIIETCDLKYSGMVSSIEHELKQLKTKSFVEKVYEPYLLENIKEAVEYLSKKHNVPVWQIMLNLRDTHDENTGEAGCSKAVHVWRFDLNDYCMEHIDTIKQQGNGHTAHGQGN